MVLKWGIVSAGKIANDFVAALKLASENEHRIVAVAARDKERAEEFAKKFDISRAYGSYLELAKDKEIDVTFIGVINSEHLRVAEIMIEHKKHVLCEKPMCINYSQAFKMIKLAQTHNVFLMEGIWSRCNPIYEKLRQELAAGTIGKVRQVIVNFGIESNAERIRRRIMCGGGLLDIGIYCLQFATMIFSNVEPIDIQTVGALTDDGVDEYASVLLKFRDNGIAAITYSISNRFDNSALVIGTKGIIKVCAPFHAPTKLLINDVPFEITLPQSAYSMCFRNSEALRFEADYVKQCLNKGLLECPLVPHSESLLWAKIMDKIRRELGVRYVQED